MPLPGRGRSLLLLAVALWCFTLRSWLADLADQRRCSRSSWSTGSGTCRRAPLRWRGRWDNNRGGRVVAIAPGLGLATTAGTGQPHGQIVTPSALKH
ncbi:hypothetical protein ZWY2020_042363 [Hordeum vulgare]|nr:hypothetical protein ZWY2020_042363 [Hordeum vulgare]